MKVTQSQLKKIWATAREIDLDGEALRDIAEQVSGSRSLSSLSKEDAIKVIDRLSNRNLADRATKNQLWMIQQMEKELGWDDNPKRLQAFMKKYAGVERLEWLTSKKAWRLIESLKQVQKREMTNGQ